MSLATLFGFSTASASEELPEIYPFGCHLKAFVDADVLSIYSRILTDTLERSEGLTDKEKLVLFDSCVASETPDGLITLVAKAMSEKSKLGLVYKPELDLVRKADAAEMAQLEADYKASNKSSIGVLINFSQYKRTDMVRLYSELEYTALASLYKSMNLSKAVQLKLKGLRSDVGLSDAAIAKAQAQTMACALKKGLDIMMDGEDTVETAKVDLEPTKEAIAFIAQKQSFYLCLPAQYITGEASKGMSDTGTGDTKAVDRGLANYFFSIIRPVFKALFNKELKYKAQDTSQFSTGLEALKTFEITSGELISQDNKRVLVNRLVGLPENEKGDPPEKVEPGVVDPNAPPPKPGAPPPAPGKPAPPAA